MASNDLLTALSQTNSALVQWTSGTVVGSSQSIDVTNYGSVVISFRSSGPITAGQVVFEASDDNEITYYPIQITREDTFLTDLSFSLANASNQLWRVACAGFTHVQVKLIQSIDGSGSVFFRLQSSAGSIEPSVVIGGSVSAIVPQPLPVSGNVSISNIPTVSVTQPLAVSGTILIGNSPTVGIYGPIAISGTVAVSIPTPLAVSGIVSTHVLDLPVPLGVSGTVSAHILDLPTPLAVSGTLSTHILDLPQPLAVSGTINANIVGIPQPLEVSGIVSSSILGLPLPVSGIVSAHIIDLPTPVEVSGMVSVGNFPNVFPVTISPSGDLTVSFEITSYGQEIVIPTATYGTVTIQASGELAGMIGFQKSNDGQEWSDWFLWSDASGGFTHFLGDNSESLPPSPPINPVHDFLHGDVAAVQFVRAVGGSNTVLFEGDVLLTIRASYPASVVKVEHLPQPLGMSGIPGEVVPSPSGILQIQSFPQVWNGDSWDRLRAANASGGAENIGVLQVVPSVFNTIINSYIPLADALTFMDGQPGLGLLPSTTMNFDGIFWNRQREANAASGTTGRGLLGAGTMYFDGTNWLPWDGKIESAVVVSGILSSNILGLPLPVGVSGTITANQGTIPWDVLVRAPLGVSGTVSTNVIALPLPIGVSGTVSSNVIGLPLPIGVSGTVSSNIIGLPLPIGVSGTITANQGNAPWSQNIVGLPLPIGVSGTVSCNPHSVFLSLPVGVSGTVSANVLALPLPVGISGTVSAHILDLPNPIGVSGTVTAAFSDIGTTLATITLNGPSQNNDIALSAGETFIVFYCSGAITTNGVSFLQSADGVNYPSISTARVYKFLATGTNGANGLPSSSTLALDTTSTLPEIVIVNVTGCKGLRVRATGTFAGNLTLVPVSHTVPNPMQGTWIANEVSPTAASVASLGDGASDTVITAVSSQSFASPMSNYVRPYTFNGTTWDRVRSANGAAGTTGTGLDGAGLMVFDGTNWQKLTTPIAVSGTISVTPSQGTFTNRSGTLTSGGVAQQMMASNANRTYLFIQNLDLSNPLWIDDTGTAVQSQPSIRIGVGGSYVLENSSITTAAISVIGAVTGQAWSAREK